MKTSVAKTILNILVFGTLFLLVTLPVLAEEGIEGPAPVDDALRNMRLKIPIGSMSDLGGITNYYDKCSTVQGSMCWYVPWIGKYMIGLYKYAVSFGAILAVVMIMIGGVMYAMGGLNQNMISKGKEYIVGSITGLIILISVSIIFNYINPELTVYKPIQVVEVKGVITPPAFCDLIVDNPLYKDVIKVKGDNKGCGKEVQVEIVGKDAQGNNNSDKYQIMEGSNTCITRECSDPASACAKMNGVYACQKSFVYGTIKAKKVGLAGNVTSAKEAYVEWIKFYGVSQGEVGSSQYIKGAKEYSIARTGNTTLNDPYYMIYFQVNDASNFVSTWDDNYYIGKDGSVVSIVGKGKCCTWNCTTIPSPGCKLFSKADMAQAKSLNIDTAKYYCAGDQPLGEVTRGEQINKVMKKYSYDDDDCFGHEGPIQ